MEVLTSVKLEIKTCKRNNYFTYARGRSYMTSGIMEPMSPVVSRHTFLIFLAHTHTDPLPPPHYI